MPDNNPTIPNNPNPTNPIVPEPVNPVPNQPIPAPQPEIVAPVQPSVPTTPTTPVINDVAAPAQLPPAVSTVSAQPNLPDPATVAPPATAPVVAKQNQNSGKPSVLVVEDEKDALDLYIYSIQSTGDFEVFGAMDGEEALIQLTQNKIDLVLLDIMMPKKDGVETLAEIKKTPQTYGTPKIVMLTNIGGDIAIDKAMGLGADGYMLKSEIEPMELIGIIKQYLNIR